MGFVEYMLCLYGIAALALLYGAAMVLGWLVAVLTGKRRSRKMSRRSSASPSLALVVDEEDKEEKERQRKWWNGVFLYELDYPSDSPEPWE